MILGAGFPPLGCFAVRIRAATDEDFSDICRLWAEVDRLHAELLPDYFQPPPEPPRSRAELRRQLAASDLITLIAEEPGGAVVGLVEARLVDTPHQPQLVPRRRLYLEELVVSPRWQRRGVGSALLDAAEASGRERGAVESVLTVWQGNAAAEAFYARLGFGRLNQVLRRPLRKAGS
jgi:ribosomal protein S18 acetylase RimI-like enzyme